MVVLSDPRYIEAEGDKPKVERTRQWFAALRAGLKTSEELSYMLARELEATVAALNEIHEFHCGCNRPGNPSACVAQPVQEFAILAVSSWGGRAR